MLFQRLRGFWEPTDSVWPSWDLICKQTSQHSLPENVDFGMQDKAIIYFFPTVLSKRTSACMQLKSRDRICERKTGAKENSVETRTLLPAPQRGGADPVSHTLESYKTRGTFSAAVIDTLTFWERFQYLPPYKWAQRLHWTVNAVWLGFRTVILEGRKMNLGK